MRLQIDYDLINLGLCKGLQAAIVASPRPVPETASRLAVIVVALMSSGVGYSAILKS